MLQTRTVPVRDLIALAKIVHAAHDTRLHWTQCESPSCRQFNAMVYDGARYRVLYDGVARFKVVDLEA